MRDVNRHTDDVDAEKLDGPKIDRRTTVKLLGAAGFTGLATSLAGCAGSEGQEETTQGTETGTSTPTADRAGGEITAGILGDTVNFLDPHRVGTSREMRVHSNVFSGIVKLNRDAEIVGDLAEDWSVPDDTTYVFQLADGATFHNGDTLDAQAAKWSLDRLRDFDESQHQGKLGNVTGIEASGNELTINLENPQAPFITFLLGGVGRAGAIVHSSAEEDRDEYNRMPIGSGPFQITGRNSGESITLERFEDYWKTDVNGNQLPYLDAIEFELIPEPSTMWSAVSSGQVDIAHEITGQFGEQAGNNPSVEVQNARRAQWLGMRMLARNPADDPEYARAASRGDLNVPDLGDDIPTANQNVRKAVAMAINREEIVNRGFFGYAEPAHQLYNPITFMYEEQPEPGHYHDPERARELLDEAGYTGSPRFQAEMVSLPIYERAATVIQQQLSNVGIDVTINLLEPSVYWGSEGVRGFDTLFGLVRGSGDVDPWMSHWRQFGEPHAVSDKGDETFGSEKLSLWHNDEFDELIIEDARTPDVEQRRELLSQAMDIFVDEAPVSMLVFTQTPVVQSPSLRNVSTPAGLRYYDRAYLAE